MEKPGIKKPSVDKPGVAVSKAGKAWMVLMALTLLSWLLHDMVATAIVVYVLIVLTTIKVYLIESVFMEIDRSEQKLQRFYLIWPAVICSLFAGATWMMH